MKFANFHLHSTYSDAAFTPEQLVLIGKALGYKALSLTDHETDGGWTEFRYCAEKQGIECVVGAEFTGMEGSHWLHLTALDYDYNDPGLRALVRRLCDDMTEYTRKRFQRALDKGWLEGITWDDIMNSVGPDTWVCHDTVQNTVGNRRLVPHDFDWQTFRKNTWFCPEVKVWKPAYGTAEEVIRTVRKAGGVVCLAHPNGQTHLVEKLVGYGLNGIEVSHPEITEETIRLAEEAADAFKLYRSGGTDHTGPMSACGGELARPVFDGLTEEQYFTLKERRLG